jgi:uncharacterized membrane protein HdeD (DUF308 family)
MMATNRKIYNSSLLFLQGLILVVFSFFIFYRPGELLSKLAFIAGAVAICTAVIFLVRYFFGEDRGRFFPDLFTALALMGMGFMLLRGDLSAREWLIVVISGLLLLLASIVLMAALELKYAFRWWWLSIITGLFSLFTSFMIISKRQIDGIPVSVFIGIQVLALGILMIWLSVLDRRIEKEYRKTIRELRMEEGG